MAKRVLVAGATGYLGRYVVLELRKRGYWVRALVRDRKKLGQPGRSLEPPVLGDVDEVFVADATQPAGMAGLCDDIDVVFSSLGMTRPQGRRSYHDVDYQGNKNILDLAIHAKVRKFVYVSVFRAAEYERLAIIKAHEDFVRALQASGTNYAIIRPTGYFSDMGEFFGMARSGRVFLIGDGSNRLNPIHGADLAEVCATALDTDVREVPAGGPRRLHDAGDCRACIQGSRPAAAHHARAACACARRCEPRAPI